MNNERAIELLHRLQDEQFDGVHGDERREALEMAVRALEGDGDTISRQQAIDFIDYFLNQPCKGHTGDFVEGMRDAYYRMRSVIKYLPSAQPERKTGKWIKVGDCSWKCNACNEISCCNANFCPDCGARMEGESDETD